MSRDDDDSLLVAYVVTRSGKALPAAELRSFLRARLPEALVPAVYVSLPELPRTASGKLDLRALPDPASAAYGPEPSEASRLAALWAELLGLAEVGEDDDFFALGGDSILVLKLCARARDRGLQITARSVYEHPTARGLAAALRLGGG